jgi:plastocyanin
MTVRKTRGGSRLLHWLVGVFLMLMLGTGLAAADEPQKFTLINVLLDGTKIWLPSSIIVQQGDAVELTLINKLDEPHGFEIKAFDIEQVVQPKSEMIVKFTAAKAGAYSYICQLHPPHLGGQILVLSK